MYHNCWCNLACMTTDSFLQPVVCYLTGGLLLRLLFFRLKLLLILTVWLKQVVLSWVEHCEQKSQIVISFTSPYQDYLKLDQKDSFTFYSMFFISALPQWKPDEVFVVPVAWSNHGWCHFFFLRCFFSVWVSVRTQERVKIREVLPNTCGGF